MKRKDIPEAQRTALPNEHRGCLAIPGNGTFMSIIIGVPVAVDRGGFPVRHEGHKRLLVDSLTVCLPVDRREEGEQQSGEQARGIHGAPIFLLPVRKERSE